jgi:hypothetical protein
MSTQDLHQDLGQRDGAPRFLLHHHVLHLEGAGPLSFVILDFVGEGEGLSPDLLDVERDCHLLSDPQRQTVIALGMDHSHDEVPFEDLIP